MDEYGAIGVITPEEDFTGASVASAQHTLFDWLQGGTVNRLVFDLSRAAFVDSEGLEAMTSAANRCQQRSGKVVLAGVDENCRKILQMTRLDRRFETYADATAALRALQQMSPQDSGQVNSRPVNS